MCEETDQPGGTTAGTNAKSKQRVIPETGSELPAGEQSRRRRLAAKGKLLHGPIVPEGFIDNGCSVPRWLPLTRLVLDVGQARAACRIHDYEYELMRQAIARGEYTAGSVEHLDARLLADAHLKRNIRLISRVPLLGRLRAWLYFLGIRAGGRRSSLPGGRKGRIWRDLRRTAQ